MIGAFPMARREALFAELQPLVTTFAGHPWAWARQEEGDVWSTLTSAAASARQDLRAGSPMAGVSPDRASLPRPNRLGASHVGGRGFGRVGDAHQRRRMVRLFECIGDHEGDRLALMVHAIVLEHVQALADIRVHAALVRPIGKPRRVAVGEDRDHAGRPFRRRAVNRGNAAVRDRAPHDGAVRLSGPSNSAA